MHQLGPETLGETAATQEIEPKTHKNKSTGRIPELHSVAHLLHFGHKDALGVDMGGAR